MTQPRERRHNKSGANPMLTLIPYAPGKKNEHTWRERNLNEYGFAAFQMLSTKPTIHMDQHGIFAIFFNVFMMKYCCWYTHTILQEIWIKNMEHIWFGTTKTMSCTITNSKIRHNYTTLLDWTSLLNCDRLNYMYTTLQCTALHCICQHDTSHHTTPQHVNGTAQ